MNAIRCRALVLRSLGANPQVEQVDVSPPGPGEVRVRMKAAGICHTDRAASRDARQTPVVLGHEGAGVVEDVGAGVDQLFPGSPVLLIWKVPCGRCARCRAGVSFLCAAIKSTTEPRVHLDGVPITVMLNAGCLAEYAVLPAEGVVPVPDGIPLQTAAVIGCAVATGVGAVLHTAAVLPGASVAVWGLGGVGLNVVVGAQIARAGLVIGVDPDADRLRLASSRGAHLLLSPAGAEEQILAATGGNGADFAFEVTGNVEVMRSALMALAPGGCLVLVGAAPRSAEFTFRPREFMSRQQRVVGCIYGSIRPHVDLPLLMDWWRQGLVPLDDMIGDPMELDDAPEVFAGRRPGPVRPVVMFR